MFDVGRSMFDVQSFCCLIQASKFNRNGFSNENKKNSGVPPQSNRRLRRGRFDGKIDFGLAGFIEKRISNIPEADYKY
jgi:hypothetical protein